MKEDGTRHVWLDMRPIDREEILSHFPGIVEKCSQEGYDVFKECIPVVPAQHYFMGGVRSGLDGRTTQFRLYAVGETCCNGVHGANRLASNSLLESLLFAKNAALDIAANYSKIDELPPEYALNNDFLKEYSDPAAILENYKKILLDAIKEADDDRPRNA